MTHTQDDVEKYAHSIFEQYKRGTGSKAGKYYPLVNDLFEIAGCISKEELNIRHGQNAIRFDGQLLWKDVEVVVDSTPIEIKSSEEEERLALKALRQAWENKIVAQSAKWPHPCSPHSSTLVVGHRLPKKRSDAKELIEDVFAVYGIQILVIDIKTLAAIAARRRWNIEEPKWDEWLNLRGFLRDHLDW